MIFLDESGKRWRRIKFGTGLLGSTVTIPITILGAAALLYLPKWGSFTLPKPFTTNQPHVKSAQTSTPSNIQATTRRQTADNSSQSTANPGSVADTSSSSQNSSSSPNPTVSSDATPTLPSTPPTSTPAPIAGQGLLNQPDQTGNSDYGHSHQPTRY